MTPVIVALGSNIHPRRQTILSGVSALARLPCSRLVATSALRETEPVSMPPGTGAFINGASLLHTSLPARELFEHLWSIERRHGRRRDQGPDRTLDLDLILYGDSVIAEPGLSVPHPRAAERLFVLEPAADLAPDMRHPVLNRSLGQLVTELRRRVEV